ncbi:ferredoxin [Candidatus Falkowbacteria bacterium]|nr:ferredoxin [Candidatus Falkowbacteria bacterium]
MMIKVDQAVCIGCGTCVALCPKTFEINADGKSTVISQNEVECAKNAAASCPVQCIAVE